MIALDMVRLGMGSGRRRGGLTPTPTPTPSDALKEELDALEAGGKLVCAWFLPDDDPDQYLTLNGTAVEGWTASHGSQKVNLAEATNPPTWDATAFGGKGGVVFDGTNDCLTGTGNVTNWPDASSDLYMLAGVRHDGTAGRRAFAYGDAATTMRVLQISGGQVPGLVVGAGGATGATVTTGAHTLGGLVDIGGTSAVYRDGVSDGTGSPVAGTLTRTRVRLGASAASTPAQFWQGAICFAAILNSTATLTDFTDLEALVRARLS